MKTGLWDSGKYARHLRKIFRKKRRIEATTSAPAASASLLDGQFFEGLRNHNCHTAAFLPEQKITPSRGETERRRRKRDKKKRERGERLFTETQKEQDR